jgi:hypothetical protein
MAANIPTTLLMKLAIGQFATSTGIAQSAGFCILASSTAIANVPGMFTSAAEWETLKNQVDKIKNGIDQVYIDVKADWIAEDREAFNEAVQAFKKELDDVKTYLSGVNTAIDAVAKAYAALWVALSALAAALLVALLALLVLFFTPYGPAAKTMAETFANWAATMVNLMVKAAAAVLTAMTGILGLSVTGVARSTGIRVAAAPTGGKTGSEDFKQVTIAWKQPSVFTVPNKALPQ